jgi:hypothetical protein
MAGTNAAFDATQFRDGIHFAMQMGTPPDPAIAPVFVFPPGAVTYWKNGVEVIDPALDRDGYPFDPEIKKVAVPAKRVTVNCAVEYTKADAEEIPVGSFRPIKAIVTLLDVDYAQVKGCREMIANDDTYAYGYEPGAMGLFEVGIHTMFFFAVQET